MKIVWEAPENVNRNILFTRVFFYKQLDNSIIYQTLSRSSSLRRNICDTVFCENRSRCSLKCILKLIYESCVHGQTHTHTHSPIFYYIDNIFVPESCVIQNFVKIVRAVFHNINLCLFTRIVFTDRQTDNPTSCYFKTNLDRPLESEIYVISNFLKIDRSVLENVNIYVLHRYNFSSFNNKR